jgi:hypothetical protein
MNGGGQAFIVAVISGLAVYVILFASEIVYRLLILTPSQMWDAQQERILDITGDGIDPDKISPALGAIRQCIAEGHALFVRDITSQERDLWQQNTLKILHKWCGHSPRLERFVLVATPQGMREQMIWRMPKGFHLAVGKQIDALEIIIGEITRGDIMIVDANIMLC